MRYSATGLVLIFVMLILAMALPTLGVALSIVQRASC